MLLKLASKLWLRAWSLILVDMSDQEISWLVRPNDHISLLSKQRAHAILTRVRLVAGLFAFFTPLWIVADIITFQPTVWYGLVIARIAATATFVIIFVTTKRAGSLRNAHLSLALLLAVPTTFFLFSHWHMAEFHFQGIQAAFSAGYAFLPFIVLAGLSIFPLTLSEGLCYAAPIVALQVFAALMHWPVLDWPSVAASLWLMMLICSVSIIAGLSQLAFMIVLVRDSIRDRMTGCFSRHSGEELLDLQFNLASRSKSCLTLAFIDLDHFKQLNDRYGHDAGDTALINASTGIRNHLRMGDILIRWGGEEFLVVMPNTDTEQACVALHRLQKSSLGMRPEGSPMTASIGLVECSQGNFENWMELVQAADRKMYEAKESGRDRIVGCELIK